MPPLSNKRLARARTHSNARTGVYPDGRVYSAARGRHAPRQGVEDQWADRLAVVNLDREKPSAGRFLKAMMRELKIRFYLENSNTNYRSNLKSFLRWFGGPPHAIERNHVRDYLEYLVDAGLSSSTVGNHLSAIRTTFDKMCYREITLGLATPRKPKQKPVILSVQEIRRLLEVARSLRDKLCLGLMYATGMRVSEVVRLRYQDIDFDRGLISVWQGKGRTDRSVTLPQSYRPLLAELCEHDEPTSYIFPSDHNDKHLSVRTVQRIVKRTVELAGIKKKATPHTLRHCFATHSFENGCDIRRIQKALGHVSLETTTIYVHLARPRDGILPSPLDSVLQQNTVASDSAAQHVAKPKTQKNVGTLRFHLRPEYDRKGALAFCRVTLEVCSEHRPIYFPGIRAWEARKDFIALSIPPEEEWADSSKWLTRAQQERFRTVEFINLLQRQIATRYTQLPGKQTHKTVLG